MNQWQKEQERQLAKMRDDIALFRGRSDLSPEAKTELAAIVRKLELTEAKIAELPDLAEFRLAANGEYYELTHEQWMTYGHKIEAAARRRAAGDDSNPTEQTR